VDHPSIADEVSWRAWCWKVTWTGGCPLVVRPVRRVATPE